MAILCRKSGRYIKVIREMTVFHYNSVEVYYYEFPSKEARDLFFARQKEVNKFLSDATLEASILETSTAEVLLSAGLDPKNVHGLEDVPEKYHKEIVSRLERALNILSDLDVLRFEWDKPSASKMRFKDLSALRELGFKDEWMTPIIPFGINAINTGAFTNQNFTYECLYRELKKIFKDDFVDC